MSRRYFFLCILSVIWSFDMRKNLVKMIRQHLGDFPKTLTENTTTKYEYCPLPGIAYHRLEKELFCHSYYLNNLCDEIRFPDWPISEPVEVFRACLRNWDDIVSRDETEENDTQEEAWKLLGLEAGDGGTELRKAYRRKARKYHPDKVCIMMKYGYLSTVLPHQIIISFYK